MKLPDYQALSTEIDNTAKKWEKRTRELTKTYAEFQKKAKSVDAFLVRTSSDIKAELTNVQKAYDYWLEVAKIIASLQDRLEKESRSLSKNKKKDLEKEIQKLDKKAKASFKDVEKHVGKGVHFFVKFEKNEPLQNLLQ